MVAIRFTPHGTPHAPLTATRQRDQERIQQAAAAEAARTVLRSRPEGFSGTLAELHAALSLQAPAHGYRARRSISSTS